MNYKILFITSLLLIVGCSKEPINVETTLIERDGIYYTKDTNKPYSGPVFTLYGNGVKKSEVFLKDGEPDGLYTQYNENGKKKEETNYKNGEKHGLWTVWDTKGDVLGKFEYDHGQINALYENDSLRSVSTYEITTGGMDDTFLTGEKIFIERINNNLDMLNEVVLFKYPRDSSSLFLMRVIAGPGDTLEIINRTVYLNSDPYPFPQKTKYISIRSNSDYKDVNIFMGKGNKDNIVLTVVPKKDDIIKLNPANAQLLLHLMVLDGHKLTIQSRAMEYVFTMTDAESLLRRKKNESVFDDYYPVGNKINPWMRSLPNGELYIDGKSIKELSYFTVKQDYYWVMGDNRDDSYDSRYWGFVPYSYITHRSLIMNNKD